MKKILVLAALMSAALAVPAMPAMAGEMAKPAVDAKCVIFPLLPDCVAQWDADAQAHGFHWTPIPNAWWTCKKADAGAGHLLDCTMPNQVTGVATLTNRPGSQARGDFICARFPSETVHPDVALQVRAHR